MSNVINENVLGDESARLPDDSECGGGKPPLYCRADGAEIRLGQMDPDLRSVVLPVISAATPAGLMDEIDKLVHKSSVNSRKSQGLKSSINKCTEYRRILPKRLVAGVGLAPLTDAVLCAMDVLQIPAPIAEKSSASVSKDVEKIDKGRVTAIATYKQCDERHMLFSGSDVVWKLQGDLEVDSGRQMDHLVPHGMEMGNEPAVSVDNDAEQFSNKRQQRTEVLGKTGMTIHDRLNAVRAEDGEVLCEDARAMDVSPFEEADNSECTIEYNTAAAAAVTTASATAADADNCIPTSPIHSESTIIMSMKPEQKKYEIPVVEQQS